MQKYLGISRNESEQDDIIFVMHMNQSNRIDEHTALRHH